MGAQDKEGEDADTIYLVPHGDLRLILNPPTKLNERTEGLGVQEGPQRIFVVSSAVMRIASPVWNRMLDPKGGFTEARQASSKHEVYLPDDSAEALLIVLQIAHLQFKELSQALTFDQLLKLAILCDKYDTVGLIRPWLPKWEGQVKHLTYHDGYEDYLFISWACGDCDTYEKLAKNLVLTSTSNAAGQLLSSTRVLLGSRMPPGAVDSILKARTITVRALLNQCNNLVDRYQRGRKICTAQTLISYTMRSVSPEESEECDTLVLGSIIRGLVKLGLWPVPLFTNDFHGSVSGLMGDLRSLHCFALGEKGGSYGKHEQCKFTTQLAAKIANIHDNIMPSGVDDSHREHMKRSAQI